MIIDCEQCSMNHTPACDDCVVHALVGDSGILTLAEEERRAIDAMSRVGLISPIRLTTHTERPAAAGS